MVKCEEQDKISEMYTAEQEPSKILVSRKTEIIVSKRADTEVQIRNCKEGNLNLQRADVCGLAVKLTDGSSEEKDIKTTVLKEHNHLEIKGKEAVKESTDKEINTETPIKKTKNEQKGGCQLSRERKGRWSHQLK